jgi:hypothetical protein
MDEDFSLLAYNAMYCSESQPTVQRNILPASSGSKNKPSMKPTLSRQLALSAGLML